MKQYKNVQSGFTVVELLIATTVFGVVLVIASTAILGLSRQYYKGIVQTRTQEVARQISQEIANNIKFSVTSPTLASNGNVQVLCVSNRRYMYRTGVKLGDPGVPAVLVQDSGCGTAIPATLAAAVPPARRELIGQNMRLAELRIDSNGPLYSVTVRIAYGDNDLLCSPGAGDCGSVTATVNAGAGDVQCKGGKGAQFCATAETSLTVVRRL